MKPYIKDGLQTEDPIDGKGPPKHRSQKKGKRQALRQEIKEAIRQLLDPNNNDNPPKTGLEKVRLG